MSLLVFLSWGEFKIFFKINKGFKKATRKINKKFKSTDVDLTKTRKNKHVCQLICFSLFVEATPIKLSLYM